MTQKPQKVKIISVFSSPELIRAGEEAMAELKRNGMPSIGALQKALDYYHNGKRRFIQEPGEPEEELGGKGNEGA